MKHIFLFSLLILAICSTQNAMSQSLYDRNNMRIGKVESDGTVRNRSNMSVGKVESDGTVRDRNNMRIGKVDGVSRKEAALIFFFDLLEL